MRFFSENLYPYLVILVGFLCVILVILGYFYIVSPIALSVTQSEIPVYEYGTITDIQVTENWFAWTRLEDYYDFVIVNGTQEYRHGFYEHNVFREVFGQVEKELAFKIGDNVTLKYQYYDWTINLNEEKQK